MTTDNGLQVLERPAVASEELAPAAEQLREVMPRLVDEGELELPTEFLLGSVGVGRLRVLRAFHVLVTTENDDFIANADEINEFGFGSNYVEAVRDLQRTIVELFFSLEADEARLGPDLQQTLATLREHLRLAP